MSSSPDDVKSPGLWPSRRFRSKGKRRVREEGARSALIAAASTVVFFGLVVWWILSSEFWPAVQSQFFNPANFAEAWPDVLGEFSLGFKSTFPFIDFQGSGFWLNVYMFLIAEVLILVFALILAMIRALRGPAFFPLRALVIVFIDLIRGVPIILLILLLGFGVPALQLPGVPRSPLFWGCLLYTSDAADDYFWV